MPIKKIEVVVLLSVVLLDCVTKLIANYYLPFQQEVSFIGDKVYFYLTYNQDSTGGQADYLLRNEMDKDTLLFISAVNGLIILSYILFIRTTQLKMIYKVLIGFSLWLILTLVGEMIKPFVESLEITPWLSSVVGKMSGLMFYCTLFFFARNSFIRFWIILIIGCGVGNLLSHFYSPYFIIDFIYVKGLYEYTKIGVFNLADLSFDIGVIGLIISLLIWCFRKIFA